MHINQNRRFGTMFIKQVKKKGNNNFLQGERVSAVQEKSNTRIRTVLDFSNHINCTVNTCEQR